jgi:excisionase family DNA binding protein
MTTEEVAKKTGLSQRRIRAWAFLNKIKAGRDYNFNKRDVDKLLARKGMRGKGK